MTSEDIKTLSADSDGLLTYEYLANHIGDCDDCMTWLAENLCRVDLCGQFTASAARFLHAVDSKKYKEQIDALIASTIGKDREHKYLVDLVASIYGDDYQAKAKDLSETDDNFRRIYKRLFPSSAI